MQIANYQFEQPYILKTTTFNNVAAVYVVYTVLGDRTVWFDVGETDKLGDRISNHKRRHCWEENAGENEIYVGIMQVSDEFNRKNIEADLRSKLLPLCGEK